jgi:preprotein translocase SecF subunit
MLQHFGQEDEVLIKTDFEKGKGISDLLAKELSGIDVEERRLEEIGPTIGRELITKSIWAILLSLIGILIYVSYRFEFEYALGAIIALIHDTLVPLALIAFTGRELSVPVVAALLTNIGYQVNDTIVICDRIRENVRLYKKMSLTDLLNLSINQTLSRTCIIMLNVTFVILSLYLFGGEVINDFAFVMLVGTISGTYSTMFIAVPVILEWKRKVRKIQVVVSPAVKKVPVKSKSRA